MVVPFLLALLLPLSAVQLVIPEYGVWGKEMTWQPVPEDEPGDRGEQRAGLRLDLQRRQLVGTCASLVDDRDVFLQLRRLPCEAKSGEHHQRRSDHQERTGPLQCRHGGADPLGGAAVDYWARIADRWDLDLTVVNPLVDPTWRFMTLDWDGKIRMDCSSPSAMASLIEARDAYHDLHAKLADDLPYIFLWKLDTKSAWSETVRNNIIAPRDYWLEYEGWTWED